ncbi:MAG: bifunctional methylenetetrahydrofolate dehydrogenase/methenyltetrahydrofolate cyclohydrolase FolD [Pseudomonadota bacterium]
MNAILIDGKKHAAALRDQVAREAAVFIQSQGRKPGLAVVLVGEDPASQVYVGSKVKQTTEAGMASFEHRLPATISETELLSLLDRLNNDDMVDGILVQLPLPRGLNAENVIMKLNPAKDADGLHPENAGRLVSGMPGLVPCTPLGCMFLLQTAHDKLDGLNAVVVGRSNLVGKPVAQLLLQQNATVTVAHSKTRDLADLCRSADILVAALGRANFVQGDWIKQGASVIDVGINRLPSTGEHGSKGKLVGDVDFESAKNRAGAITPVPGGVGPMTVACLLANTLTAACRRAKLAAPQFSLNTFRPAA